MDNKKCTQCKRDLPLENFSKHKTSQNGIRSYCKECAKSYKDKWDKDKEEHRIEYRGKYNREHIEKILLYSKTYRINHLEQCRENDKKRYILLKDKIRESRRISRPKYYQKNKESIKEKVKAYQQLNAEKTKVYKRKNKLRRKEIAKNLPCTFTSAQWVECLQEFDSQCAYCGKRVKLTQDHIIPVTKNGGYEASNIIPVCHSCNSSKNGSYLAAWYPMHPSFTLERLNKIHDYLTSKG